MYQNNSKTPLVSVIVPVYKAEKTLGKCLDSILAQSYGRLEIVIVDDGSPDTSGVICDKYAERDSRIRVIHQANGGVSKARQTGMELAEGEYTIHVDPDDRVEPDMIEELVAKAVETNADMVICDYVEDEGNKHRLVRQDPTSDGQPIDPKTVLRKMLFQQLHGSCCNKLVRRACYNGVFFTPSHLNPNTCQGNTCQLCPRSILSLLGRQWQLYMPSYQRFADPVKKGCDKSYERRAGH